MKETKIAFTIEINAVAIWGGLNLDISWRVKARHKFAHYPRVEAHPLRG